MTSLRSAIYRAETQAYASDDEKSDAIVAAAVEWFRDHVEDMPTYDAVPLGASIFYQPARAGLGQWLRREDVVALLGERGA